MKNSVAKHIPAWSIQRATRTSGEGERCDLVLTPEGRHLAKPEAEETLFEDPEEVPLDDALWLEVKVVAQFQLEGANGNYSSQLLSTVREDVAKLSKDRGILHAGLLIVLFVQHFYTCRCGPDRCLSALYRNNNFFERLCLLVGRTFLCTGHSG